MAIDDTKHFTFVSKGLPKNTFSVVEFKGTEGISRLYEFGITLASDDPDIDLKGVLQNPVSLTIHSGGRVFPIHGILSQFEQLHEVKGHYFYRTLLVPRLWHADLYRENQLFLDKTVPDIIEEILKQAGLTPHDYELKLTKNYPPWEYICQYRETDLDFISRWMEREGIYYFFEQGEDNEKLIVTDSSAAHKDIPGEKIVPYSPPSGLMPEEEAIRAFICRQKRLPKTVILKDYNYRKPSLDLKAMAVVDVKGRGNVYFYGEHFKTLEEGAELAKVRAEEIRCRENVFHGEGTQPGLCPGFLFELAAHYRESYNRNYLIVEIEHQGRQTGAFWAGTVDKLTEEEQQLTYANAFTTIPSDVQFRPVCNTPKPRFYGTMNAKVDAAGIGEYAELDNEGRYKIKLPFDMSDGEGGKASRWVRMAQPYAGADHGMHFPLHKGTEVLLTFVDGDPDRPIIAGAVPNIESKSVVTDHNYTSNRIKSAGGNVLEMEDQIGKKRITMLTPTANSWIRIGAHNDPASGGEGQGKGETDTDYEEDFLPGDGIRILTEGTLTVENPLNVEYHDDTLNQEDQHANWKKEYKTAYQEMEKEGKHIKLKKEVEDHDHVLVRIGESVNVKKGDSIEIMHGGKHIEWLYRNNGTKRTYKMESGGVAPGDNWYEEKRWWGDGSEVYSKAVDENFNTTERVNCQYGEGKFFTMDFYEEWPPKYTTTSKVTSGFEEISSMTVEGEKKIINNFAAESNINIENKAYGSNINIENLSYGSNMNIKNSTSGINTTINNKVGANIDISSNASLDFKIDSSVAAGFGIKSYVGGMYLFNTVTQEFDAKMMGIGVQKAAPIKAKQQSIVLDSLQVALSQKAMKLEKKELGLGKSSLDIYTGILMQGL